MIVKYTHVTQEEVEYMEHHEEWELGGEERQEPLRSKHVSLQSHVHEVLKQIW